MKPDIKTIKKAVTANRGGLADATDPQIMRVWNALLPETQKQYLESIKETKEKTDASGDKT